MVDRERFQEEGQAEASNEWRGVEEASFEPEILEGKREKLKEFGLSLRDLIKAQIESVPENSQFYHGSDDYVGWRFCGACFEASIDRSKPFETQREFLRERTYAEARVVQDFIFLEEARAWLPEGCEAEERLTSLFHKAYCEDESGKEVEDIDMGHIIVEDHDLAKVAEKANGELPLRLQEFDEEAKTLVPTLYSDKDYDKESYSIDVRRRDFVAYARERLGEDSEEYRLILAEAYKLSRVTDDAENKSVGSEYAALRDRLENYSTIKERAPLAEYLSQRDVSKHSGAGSYMPLRLAVSLTAPME